MENNSFNYIYEHEIITYFISNIPEFLIKEIENKKLTLFILETDTNSLGSKIENHFLDYEINSKSLLDVDFNKPINSDIFLLINLSKDLKLEKIFSNFLKLAENYFVLIRPIEKLKLNNFSKESFFPLYFDEYALIYYKEIELEKSNKPFLIVIYSNTKNNDLSARNLEEINNYFFKQINALKKLNKETLHLLNYKDEKLRELSKNNDLLIDYLDKERNNYNILNHENKKLGSKIKEFQSRKVVKFTDRFLTFFRRIKAFFKNNNNSSEPNIKKKEVVPFYKNLTPKYIKNIKVAVIFDESTYNSFKYEFDIIPLEPHSWQETFEREKPDIFFCESICDGLDSHSKAWKDKIYQKNYFKQETLSEILKYCKSHNIVTIFWNNNDFNHYNEFSDTASKFNFIFTTVEESIKKYEQDYNHKNIYPLMFATQPILFNPIESNKINKDFIFADMEYNMNDQYNKIINLFDYLIENGYNLKIYDSSYYNSISDSYRKFPQKYDEYMHPPVDFEEMVDIYKESSFAINLNTTCNSKTMFSRRIFELMSSNTTIFSNYSLGLDILFGDNIIYFDCDENYLNFNNLDKKRINNLYNVLKNHTYHNRFKQILNDIHYPYLDKKNNISIYYVLSKLDQIDEIFEHFNSITYLYKKLVLLLDENIPNSLVKNIYMKFSSKEIHVYSLNFILNKNNILKTLDNVQNIAYKKIDINMNKLVENETDYFIFSDTNLESDFIEKAILHFSYVDESCGIKLGDKFLFEKTNEVENIVFANKNFSEVFNSKFNGIKKDYNIYTCKI